MKKTFNKVRWLAVMLLVIVGTSGVMAQNPGGLPHDETTQDVCVGTEPYAVEPGDVTNTLVWSINGGTAIVDWVLTGQGNAEISVKWITPGVYYLSVTENSTIPISCSTTQTVVVTVNPSPAAPISGGDITECEENPIQTITAVATVPAGVVIIWYDAATEGNVVADPSLSAVGTVTYYAEAVDASGTCASSTRTAVALTIIESPAVPLSGGDITECLEDPIQTITATATVPTGFTVVWYDAATEGNVVADPSLSAVGTVTYYAEAVDATGTCTSLARTAVKLTITVAPDAPLSGGDITECTEDPIQTIIASATVPAGFTVVWYDAATAGSIVTVPSLSAIGTITYYAEAVDATGTCKSLTRTAVVLTITNAPDAPISDGDITECAGDPVQTITAIASVPAGFTVVWYDAATAGSIVIDPSLSAIGTKTYYAEAVDTTGTCISLTRTAVILTITPTPTTSKIFHN